MFHSEWDVVRATLVVPEAIKVLARCPRYEMVQEEQCER